MKKAEKIRRILERRLTTEKLLTMAPADRSKAILAEKIKCFLDPKYLIETYFTVDIGGTRQPFILFPHQKDALESYVKFPNNITMKTRQMGFTTFTSAYIATKLINHNGYKVLIISKEMGSSMDFLKNIKSILDKARDITRLTKDEKSESWLIPEYQEGYNNKGNFTLENESFVKAQGNTDDAGRGISGLDLAVIDECSAIDKKFPDRMKEMWSALGPALSTVKGRSIVISCVTKDTFIFTDKGIQQIEDFVLDDDGMVKGYEIEPYNILGHDGFRKGKLFKNNGFGKTFKIETKYTELEGHEDHKVYAYSDGRYDIFKMSGLKVGDFINVKRGMEIWGNNDDVSDFVPTTYKVNNKFFPKIITKDIGYFLGLYIAEGCMYKYNRNGNTGGWIDITCGDSEITEVFNKLGLRWTTNDNLHFRICSKNLMEFMSYLGFKQEKANFKEIPKRLMQCSREVLVSLLQGMFDGDGGINIKEGRNRVGYASTSEKLINQVRTLLGNVGILSGKYKLLKENDHPHLDKNGHMIKANFDCHTLELTGQFSDMFVEKIGFRLERKKIIIGNLTNKPFQFTLPNGDEIIDKLYADGFTGQGLRRKHGIRIDNDVITSLKTEKIFLLLKDEEFKQKAKHEYLFDDNSVWVPITSIVESEGYTYDVSLPEIEGDKWCHSVTHSLTMSYNTPFGASGWYYDTYTNHKQMGFNIIDAHWTKHPMFNMGTYQWIFDESNKDGGYVKFLNDTWPESLFDKDAGVYLKIDKDKYNFVRDGKTRSPWYDFESVKLGPRKTACELDCSFVGTGGEVFGVDILREMKLNSEMTKVLLSVKEYKEFISPIEEHKYVIACDVASGDGSDYSTITVLDLDTLEICGSYKDQPYPKAFATTVYDLGIRYNNAHVVVENAGGGGTTLQELKEMKYPHIYYSTLNKKDESLGVKKRKIGLWMSEDVRTKGGDKLEEYIREYKVRIPDSRYADEFYNWIWDRDGKRRHAPGKHDDLIVSLQHAIYYHAYVYKKNIRNRNNFTNMFGRESIGTFNGAIESMNSPFNMFEAKRNNGLDIIDQKKNFVAPNSADVPRRRGMFLT